MKTTIEQDAIIQHTGGHAKVMAVAGSGKTTTMIERIIHLIKTGSDPRRILVLMFNASASKEFSEKLSRRAGEEGITSLPEVRTFHAMALKLCRHLENKNIIKRDRLETKDWVLSSIADNVVSPFIKKNKAKKEVQEQFYQYIDLVKSDIQTPVEKLKEIPDITGSEMPSYFAEAYDKFEEVRKDRGLRFFSDLVRDPVMSILENPDNKQFVENIYDHIILDEYQDINEVQQRMTVYIAGSRANVMAVGDADQCIYEWRGAKPEYIVSLFEEDFEDARVFTLSRTYRYGDKLSLFVNNIITQNENRDDKICISYEGNPKTEIEIVESDYKKESPISKNIQDMISQGYSYPDIAILLRKFSLSLNVELDLLKSNIPYYLIGANSIFQRNESMAIEGAFHIANESFEGLNSDYIISRIDAFLKTPYAGIKSEDAINHASRIARDATNGKEISDSIIALLKKVAESANKRASKFAKTKYESISGMRRMAGRETAYKLINRYVDQVKLYDYFEWSSSTEAIAIEKETLVEELMEYMKRNRFSVSDFIAEWVDLSNKSESVNNEINMDRVLITSIHRSKGLEWPLVIIPELKDEAFPSIRKEGKRKTRNGGIDNRLPSVLAEKKKRNKFVEESERRLFYVGSTRAINKLLLVHPKDPALNYWSRRPERTYPEDDLIATRYLFEGGIDEVDRVVELMSGNKKYIKVVDKKLYQKYLHTLGDYQSIIKDEMDLSK